MDRRNFILGGASMAAGFAPERADASIPALGHRPLAEVFPEIDWHEDVLISGARGKLADVRTASGWRREQFFGNAMATMLWTGHLRGLSEQDTTNPEVIAAFGAREQAMSDTVLASLYDLEAMTEADMEMLDAHVRGSDDILGGLRLELVRQARANGLPDRVLKRFDRVQKEVSWRLRNQGIRPIRAEVLSKVNRLSERTGEDWRAEALAGADMPFYRPLDGDAARRNYERQLAQASERPAPYGRQHQRLKRTGNVMLGIFIGCAVLGLAAPITLIFGGVTLGLVSLILAIIYHAAASREKRDTLQMLP